MENNCLEIRNEDIVRIDVYLSSQCNVSVPPQVNCTQLVKTNLFTGDPVVTLTLNLGDTIPMQDIPTLKIQNAAQQAGNVYNHELQATVPLARQRVESAIEALFGKDFCAVYTRSDGQQDFSYALPNTAKATVDETLSNNSVTLLKIKILSMSALISLTA